MIAWPRRLPAADGTIPVLCVRNRKWQFVQLSERELRREVQALRKYLFGSERGSYPRAFKFHNIQVELFFANWLSSKSSTALPSIEIHSIHGQSISMGEMQHRYH